MKTITVFFGVLACVTLSPTTATAQDKLFAKYTNNVGNCIFSNAPMPGGTEKEYKGIGTKFSAANPIEEGRCYFPKTIAKYAKPGRLANSMRDSSKMFTFFTIETVEKGRELNRIKMTWNMAEEHKSWTKYRIFFNPKSKYASFKDKNRATATNGKFDIDKQVRALARKERKELPYTAKVCLRFFVEYADNVERVWDKQRNAEVERYVVMNKNMAMDCVDYTAK